MQFFIGHVNLTLGEKVIYVGPGRASHDLLTIDFLPPQREPGVSAPARQRGNDRRDVHEQPRRGAARPGAARRRLLVGARRRRGGSAFPERVNTLGVIYQRRGAFDSAERAFAYALERDRSNTRVMSNLARLFERMGRADEARIAEREAREPRAAPALQLFQPRHEGAARGQSRSGEGAVRQGSRSGAVLPRVPLLARQSPISSWETRLARARSSRSPSSTPRPATSTPLRGEARSDQGEPSATVTARRPVTPARPDPGSMLREAVRLERAAPLAGGRGCVRAPARALAGPARQLVQPRGSCSASSGASTPRSPRTSRRSIAACRRPEEVHLNRGVIYSDCLRQEAAAERELAPRSRSIRTTCRRSSTSPTSSRISGERDEALALYERILAIDPRAYARARALCRSAGVSATPAIR